MGSIYFMVGLPESGQSDWISEFMNVHVVRPRETVATIATTRGVPYDHALALSDTYAIDHDTIVRVRESLQTHQTAVVDQPNMSAGVRHRILRTIPESTYRCAVVFPINRAIAYDRLARGSRGRPKMPWHVVERMIAQYEPPQTRLMPLHRFWHTRVEFDHVMMQPRQTASFLQTLRYAAFILRYRWSYRIPRKKPEAR